LFVRIFAAATFFIALLSGCAQQASPVSGAAANPVVIPPNPAVTQPPAYALDDTEVRDLASKVLQRDYQLYVGLPDSYRTQPARRYPVLFVTDARYAFPLIRSIARRVGDHGKGLDDFILVGLSYAKGDTPAYSRNRDYTPTDKGGETVSDMPGRPPLYGQAELYRRFIAEEVFPFVARAYRADMGRKIFAGHSYGALLGAHILLTEPTMFEHYILGSPSLWFNHKLMFARERAYAAEHTDLRADVFMATGAYEAVDLASPNPRYHHEDDLLLDMQAFERVLRSRRYPGLRIRSTVIDDEDHLTVFPAIITRGLTAVLAPARNPVATP